MGDGEVKVADELRRVFRILYRLRYHPTLRAPPTFIKREEMAALLSQLRGLARSLRDNLQRFVLPEARPTGRSLGTGSYGSVEEVEVNGMICAGKKIHEALLDAGNFGVQVLARKYAEECQLMTEMRHPHVVQFIGICFRAESPLPLLVMERLEMSLDDLLETTPDVPLTIKRSVLEGTARGLLYLHQRDPPVIHRYA